VRGQNDPGQRAERVTGGQRLGLGDVENRSQAVGAHRVYQGVVVDDGASGRVDEHRARAHQRELAGRHQADGLRQQRRVNAHDRAPPEQVVKADRAGAGEDRVVVGHVGAVKQHLGGERSEQLDYPAADPGRAEYPHRPAVVADVVAVVRGEAGIPGVGACQFGYRLACLQDRGQRVLGDGVGVGVGSGGDQDAAGPHLGRHVGFDGAARVHDRAQPGHRVQFRGAEFRAAPSRDQHVERREQARVGAGEIADRHVRVQIGTT
jgi:hypothetical protein